MTQRKSTVHRSRTHSRTVTRKRRTRNTHTMGVALTGVLLLAVAGLALYPLEQRLVNGGSKSTGMTYSSQSNQRRYKDDAIAFAYPLTWKVTKDKNGTVVATRQAGLQFAPTKKGEDMAEPTVSIDFTNKENPGLDLPVGTSCNREKDTRVSGKPTTLMICKNSPLTIELYNVALGNKAFAVVKTSYSEERDGLVINDIIRSLSVKAPPKK